MSRFLPVRFAVVVVLIAASFRYSRREFIAFLGKMSLTYTYLSISFTMVKSRECIGSWFNMGIHSSDGSDKSFALSWYSSIVQPTC